MTEDLSSWKRRVAVRKFNEIIAGADKRGEPMSYARAARAAAGYVDATAGEVLKWVKGAGNV